jgi:hypothetical protein
MTTRHALVGTTPTTESVEFRTSDRGRFVSRLRHRQKLSMVETNEGLTIPASVHAERVWESCHGVAHMLGECPRHWSECLSREPWWGDTQAEAYYRRTWPQGGQVVEVARSSKSAYVAFVLEHGSEVVFVAASNSLAHMGEETRTLPATMRKIGDTDQMEMIDPNYLAAPLREDVVLLGDDGTGQDLAALMDAERLKALDEDIRTATKKLAQDPHDVVAKSKLDKAQKQKDSDVEYYRSRQFERDERTL